MRQIQADKLRVEIHDTRAQMGMAAARACAQTMREMLSTKPELNMIFAAAPSQNEVLSGLVALAQAGEIDFSRVNAFHMDEYIGLTPDAPQRFSRYLHEHLWDKVKFYAVHELDASAPDAEAECARYAALLDAHPCDILILGIGENGHIAFNDPPVANFADPLAVKAVELDHTCRMQQVHDGCFADLSAVPTHALTLTIPALMRAQAAFCVVPARTKAEAVRRTIQEEVSTACPATVLRTHPCATLYLDADSASLCKEG